jgi:hypothetical protein
VYAFNYSGEDHIKSDYLINRLLSIDY